MSSKGPFPGQEFLLRVTSSCLLAHRLVTSQRAPSSAQTSSCKGSPRAPCVKLRDGMKWVIVAQLGQAEWFLALCENGPEISQTAARLCTGQSWHPLEAFFFGWVFLLPIFLFEKGGHTVLATDRRHHGITVIYCLVLSNAAQQICCFQEEIHQKKSGNIKR